eukprot:12519.XXX_26234_26395_1 [CDS] Oithona nana genome sequencing.
MQQINCKSRGRGSAHSKLNETEKWMIIALFFYISSPTRSSYYSRFSDSFEFAN